MMPENLSERFMGCALQFIMKPSHYMPLVTCFNGCVKWQLARGWSMIRRCPSMNTMKLFQIF